MMATALLDHGYRLLDFASGFEIAQGQNSIRQVAQIHGCFGGCDYSVLGHDENRAHALLVEISAEFVQLIVEIPLTRHRIEIAVETVNHYQLHARIHTATNANGEFAWRQFGGINLLDSNSTAVNVF